MSEGHRTRHLLFAFLGGAATGAVAALLTAPASGAETRARLRAKGSKEIERARQVPDALKAATHAAEEAFMKALERTTAEKGPAGNGRGGKARQLPAAAE